jgi:hypothetical protein
MTDLMPAEVVSALIAVGLIGGVFGLLGGFFGSKHRLFGAILLGIIGGIAAASIARIAGATPGFSVGEGFSAIYAAVGGFVLGFVVSRSTV